MTAAESFIHLDMYIIPKKEEDGYETLIEEEKQHSGPFLTRHKSYDNAIDKFKTLEEKLNNINDLILKSL